MIRMIYWQLQCRRRQHLRSSLQSPRCESCLDGSRTRRRASEGQRRTHSRCGRLRCRTGAQTTLPEECDAVIINTARQQKLDSRVRPREGIGGALRSTQKWMRAVVGGRRGTSCIGNGYPRDLDAGAVVEFDERECGVKARRRPTPVPTKAV